MQNFIKKDVQAIPRLGLQATELLHKTTGMKHVHVQRDDENRTFALAFQTRAPDRTGVPHILEHMALCGSRNFPVRDPFFKMQTRSLANFMNAMTGFDYTYYPFATTNPQDYKNLQQIYADACFRPLLREVDFFQEGWRLDPGPPEAIKGVVFNEMKGQMSMPAYQFYMSWYSTLAPEMQFSAGDPLSIPDLTWDQLVKYHRQHYHPSNCLGFSYGPETPEETLSPIMDYLNDYSEPIEASKVPQVKDFPSKNITVEGPLDSMYDESRQHKASLTWNVGSTDLIHTLTWRVLSLLLAEGHSSPLYQELIDTGIAPEFSVNSGIDELPTNLVFTVGLQGLKGEQIPEFKQRTLDTLHRLSKTGFPSDRVDAIIYQAELADRQVDAHFGMSLLSRVVGRAFHPSQDFMKTLDSARLISDFKSQLEQNPNLFQDELKKMLDNPIFEFVSVPSSTFEESRNKAEEKVLEKKVKTADIEVLKKNAQLLAEAQSAEEDLNCLPTVTPKDISRDAPQWPVKELGNVMIREVATQGISYVRMLKSLNAIDPQLIPYTPLYADALLNVGTTHHEMAELEQLLMLYTGGITAGVSTRPESLPALELSVGASALDSRLPKMYELLEDILKNVSWRNGPKLKALVDGSAANVMNSLSSSGHRYALSRSAAALNTRKNLAEHASGISHVRLIQELSMLPEADLVDALAPKLEAIHATSGAGRAGLTCESNIVDAHPIQDALKLFGEPSTSVKEPQFPLASQMTQMKLPLQISHVGAALNGPGYTSYDSAALQVLASLLTHKHLHPLIREQGGAYGGGAVYNAVDGLFYYYSYRDPSPSRTVDVITKAGEWAADHSWTKGDVEEGLLTLFQSIDSPRSPRTEITSRLLLGVSDEMRQKHRHDLLSVNADDLKRVAIQYLVGKSPAVCVVGPDSAPSGWDEIQL